MPAVAKVVLQRLAYFPQEAAQELSKFSLMIAIDARLPVAMFGYKYALTLLVTQPLMLLIVINLLLSSTVMSHKSIRRAEMDQANW